MGNRAATAALMARCFRPDLFPLRTLPLHTIYASALRTSPSSTPHAPPALFLVLPHSPTYALLMASRPLPFPLVHQSPFAGMPTRPIVP